MGAGEKSAQVAALITKFYRNDVAPLEKSVQQTAPEKLRMHPVYLALCNAYFRNWSILRDAAEASQDGQVSVDEKVMQEIDELSPWVLFERAISSESARTVVSLSPSGKSFKLRPHNLGEFEEFRISFSQVRNYQIRKLSITGSGQIHDPGPIFQGSACLP